MDPWTALYDPEADSLVVYREGRKNHASVKLGEVVVDLDKDMNVSGVEIINPDLLYGIPKEKLERIASASIRVQQRGPVFWVFVVLAFTGSAETETLSVPLQMEQPISA